MDACRLLNFTFVHVEGDGADCDADHAFRVVEEFYGLGVQGEVVCVLYVGDIEKGNSERGTTCPTSNTMRETLDTIKFEGGEKNNLWYYRSCWAVVKKGQNKATIPKIWLIYRT